MSNPQQPELRRSGRGGATPQESGAHKAAEPKTWQGKGGRSHGSDRGGKGGGRPPEQSPDHP
ncbi:hypothetical protein ACIPJG_23735 [Streptomyces halstedii]|uniref:hypothetical protein n=1 Tax=Streptomyces TaxID=1883 RepID=UPI000804DFFC|nr:MULTISPECIES: hypothetical protein [Streptomyces]WSX39643.1 hypothetical protein OG291_30345 [Streptomyces halstedii]MCW8218570.1 hypothetical protein [Streptomyces griseolus]MYQ53247.1 hypothetical protein [Streptomyces sp. SID4941]MYR73696.1 hypothetical protein [Streptomyces sp. SID4925]MYY18598.1 hypothetical protein [Streptomyces sp. SID4912]